MTEVLSGALKDMEDSKSAISVARVAPPIRLLLLLLLLMLLMSIVVVVVAGCLLREHASLSLVV